jgi:hypothetical protein
MGIHDFPRFYEFVYNDKVRKAIGGIRCESGGLRGVRR